jgi:hypothetical protein
MPIPGSISGFGVSSIGVLTPMMSWQLQSPIADSYSLLGCLSPTWLSLGSTWPVPIWPSDSFSSGFRSLWCRGAHVLGTPDPPIPDVLFATCPLYQRLMMVSGFRISRFCNVRVSCPWNPRYTDSRFSELRLSGISRHVSLLFGRFRSYREIADRDFLLHNFLTIENSDEQNADGARSFATCPRRRTARIDSRGFGTYDVLVLMASRTPISRSTTLRDPLTRVLEQWTVQIWSGNRVSRFQYATVLYS